VLDGVVDVVEGDDELTLHLEHVAFARAVRRTLINAGVFEFAQLASLKALTADGEPNDYSIDELLEEFLEWRRERVRASGGSAGTAEQVARTEARVVALMLTDEVTRVIRSSADDETACLALMNFLQPAARARLAELPHPLSHDYARGFTRAQAEQVVLEHRVPRSIFHALREWSESLAALPTPGGSERINAVVRDEITAARELFARPRQTIIETWRD
jgi:DNA gyrase/topoisomerase IV subunit A